MGYNFTTFDFKIPILKNKWILWWKRDECKTCFFSRNTLFAKRTILWMINVSWALRVRVDGRTFFCRWDVMWKFLSGKLFPLKLFMPWLKSLAYSPHLNHKYFFRSYLWPFAKLKRWTGLSLCPLCPFHILRMVGHHYVAVTAQSEGP